MKTTSSHAWTRRAGFALGIAFASIAFLGWKMPSGEKPSGLSATLTVAPTAEVAVEPSGRIASAGDVRPGGSLAGSAVVQNLTGGPLAVSLRTVAQGNELDDQLRVNLELGGDTVRNGTLGEARRWQGGVRIPAGARRRVNVRVLLPREARGYEFRVTDLKLELRGEPVR